jgi:DNA-binding protein Fis
MVEQLLEKLMKLYYQKHSSLLAVVENSGILVGVIYKEKLVRKLSDLEINPDEDILSVLKSLIDLPLADEFLPILEKNKEISVINLKGEYVADWGKLEIIKALEKIPIPNINKFKPQKISSQKDKQLDWFKDMLLENIQHPLYVTDLNGKTLFYNYQFKENIIKYKKIQNIKNCEKFFLDVNRKLVAHMLTKGITLTRPQRGLERINNYDFIMIPLEKASQARGYLYEFLPKGEAILTYREPSKSISKLSTQKTANIDSLEDHIKSRLFSAEKKIHLTEILHDFEKEIISICMENFKNNISHTAKFLNIPRQTLQFRIKKLKIALSQKGDIKKRVEQKISSKKKSTRVRKGDQKKDKKEIKSVTKKEKRKSEKTAGSLKNQSKSRKRIASAKSKKTKK